MMQGWLLAFASVCLLAEALIMLAVTLRLIKALDGLRDKRDLQ